MRKAAHLKALLRNKAEEKGVSAVVLLHHYIFGQVLRRVAVSPYKANFVLKGGLLIASELGIELLTTLDMDLTLRRIRLTPENMKRIWSEIFNIPLDDGFSFRIVDIEEIRESQEYGGLRLSFVADMEGIRQPLKIGITAGDAITPKVRQAVYRMIIDNSGLMLPAYPLETVLAEKLDTILSRGTLNTRMRDFYDVCCIFGKHPTLTTDHLHKSFAATARRRGTAHLWLRRRAILAQVSASPTIRRLWGAYQKKYPYARGVEWGDVLKALETFCA